MFSCILVDDLRREEKKMKNMGIERYLGHPVYIATESFQRRTHHKKRINKKWLKRYGTWEINMMPHNQVVMMDDGTIYMTKKTWEKLKNEILGDNK